MELKKSQNSDLENKRGTFLQIGLVISLSLILIAFDWTSKPDASTEDYFTSLPPFEIDVMPVTRPEKPLIPKQRITDIITIIPDDIKIDDDFFFNPEATPDTKFDFRGFINEPDYTDEPPVDFLPIEDMPTFNGGDPAVEFRKYIAQNLHYPDIAIENSISGRVYVQFIIDTKGRLINAEVIRHVDPALDKEALRVIMESPLWTPGKQREKPVKVRFTFPIAFVLQ